ncbi:hypothetical protein [Desulfolithobacter sp.]
MKPTTPLPPVLRVQRLTAFQGNRQDQRSPFTQGQVLQATVSGKTGDGQFILDLGSRQVTAEARAPLTIGSRLDLQVVSTTPQVELQIIHEPLNRWIGQNLHLFDRQAKILASLPDLASRSSENPALSKTTREVLDQVSQLFNRLSPRSSPILSQTETAYLEEKLIQLLSQSSAGREAPTLQTSRTARQILQNFLSQVVSPDTLSSRSTLVPKQPPEQLAGILQSLLDKELPGHGLDKKQLSDLLTGLTHQLSRDRPPAELEVPALKKFLNILGLNFERLLARGQGKEAAGTLKAALHELQHLQDGETIPGQTRQLLQTLDLFGLLQAKLSSEGLLFIPLPLPFLEQGYILLEEDRNPTGQEEENSKNARMFSLHLKLQGLGNLCVEMYQQEDELTLRFLTEGPEQAAFLSNFREELRRCIAPAKLHSVQFLTGADEPLRNILDRLAPKGSGILDTRI